MGPDVTELVKTVINIRELVDGVDVLEDATALKIQEMIFEQCDRRAILLQFVSSLDVLYHSYVCHTGKLTMPMNCGLCRWSRMMPLFLMLWRDCTFMSQWEGDWK